jgi:hypothetical protein
MHALNYSELDEYVVHAASFNALKLLAIIVGVKAVFVDYTFTILRNLTRNDVNGHAVLISLRRLICFSNHIPD